MFIFYVTFMDRKKGTVLYMYPEIVFRQEDASTVIDDCRRLSTATDGQDRVRHERRRKASSKLSTS